MMPNIISGFGDVFSRAEVVEYLRSRNKSEIRITLRPGEYTNELLFYTYLVHRL